MKSRITNILNIEKPIIQGPMSWLTDAQFVAAVSEAGGLGFLGPNGGSALITRSVTDTIERFRQEIKKIKQLTDKPFGVPLVISRDMAYTEQLVEVIIEEGVTVVLANEYIKDKLLYQKLKSHQIKIIYRPLTPTIENAKEAESFGADIYVATGFDEGGTVPERVIGTFSIVPMIADAIDIPVVAAGGIGDYRTVNAAFALGAEGVFAGSLFIATTENPAAENVKQKIVDSNATDLLLFRTLPAYYRSLPGKLAEELVEMDRQGYSNSELSQHMGGGANMKLGMLDGDTENGFVSVGTGISTISEIKPVENVIKDVMKDIQ